MPAPLRNLAVSLSSPTLGNASVAVNLDKAIGEARTRAYPKQVLYLIASFIALVSLSHFLSLLYRYGTRNRATGKRRTSISTLRLPTAFVDSLRALAFRWTVPTGSSFTLNLAELGLTVGYIGVLLSWSFVDTTSTLGVRVAPRYFAVRVGRLAASQFPIMTALGTRNNLISWLTGVSFEKLNYFHRLSARVICILLWIHGGGLIAIGLEFPIQLWVRCGLLAASALTLLIVLSVRPVRKRNYESFLLVHFVLVFIVMVTVYFHLAGIELPFYGAWPSMVIWGLDLFLRFARFVVYNFAYLNPFCSRSTENLDATVDVLSEEFLRVNIRRPSHFHWRPGQSAFLSFPSVTSYPFQAHPFTIATIDEATGTASGEKKLVFLFRIHNGFTRELMNMASLSETYKVFITGPYSSPPVLVGYETVILIAGGSGITFTLPLLLDLISRAKRNERRCQKVIFLWAIRSAEQVRWIEDILAPSLVGIPSSITVVIKIYITKPGKDSKKQADDEFNTESDDKKKATVLNSPFVSFEDGRPDIQNIIQNEIAKTSGPMSVNACGNHGLADAVRKAIRVPRLMDILRGGPTVTLHIESFGS